MMCVVKMFEIDMDKMSASTYESIVGDGISPDIGDVDLYYNEKELSFMNIGDVIQVGQRFFVCTRFGIIEMRLE
jgi:hypothetical protein